MLYFDNSSVVTCSFKWISSATQKQHIHIASRVCLSVFYHYIFATFPINDLEEEIQKMSQSPLHPYVRGLRYLKILGLPLKFEEDEKGMIFVKENRFIKCILLTAGTSTFTQEYNNF